MHDANQYYAPDIAAKAVVEFTNAFKLFTNVDYAIALINDPRMASNRGHFASCGLNMREVKEVKSMLPETLPLMTEQRKAIQFLDALDMQQEALAHGRK